VASTRVAVTVAVTAAVAVTEPPPNNPARTAPRGGPAPRGRRSGPALVIWSTVALFAAMFAFLTYRLSAGEAPTASRPVQVRLVIKRRVVTTILPTPGRSSVTSSGAVAGTVSSSGYAPVTTSAS
jgi:hypothetical protein